MRHTGGPRRQGFSPGNGNERLCDYRSTDDAEDGRPNLLFRVPALPGPAAPGPPDAGAESAASLFFYNPAHRWW